MRNEQIIKFLDEKFEEFEKKYIENHDEYFGAMFFREYVKKAIIDETLTHKKLMKKMEQLKGARHKGYIFDEMQKTIDDFLVLEAK